LLNNAQPLLAKLASAYKIVPITRRAIFSLLFLEIEVAELLPISIADDEAGVVEFFNRPRWRESAGGAHHIAQRAWGY
jgi:hypothetical protein